MEVKLRTYCNHSCIIMYSPIEAPIQLKFNWNPEAVYAWFCLLFTTIFLIESVFTKCLKYYEVIYVLLYNVHFSIFFSSYDLLSGTISRIYNSGNLEVDEREIKLFEIVFVRLETSKVRSQSGKNLILLPFFILSTVMSYQLQWSS